MAAENPVIKIAKSTYPSPYLSMAFQINPSNWSQLAQTYNDALKIGKPLKTILMSTREEIYDPETLPKTNKILKGELEDVIGTLITGLWNLNNPKLQLEPQHLKRVLNPGL